MAIKKASTRAKSKTPVQPVNDTQTSTSFKLKKAHVIIIAGVILLAVVLYLNKGLFIASLVNGKPIFRTTVIKELERQGGKQTLDSLVTEELIYQEANKQHISISDKEITDEIKKIEENITKQGQSFDSVLVSQGMTRDSLKNRIKLQKLVEKMVGKDISVSDKEVDDYMEKNKDTIPPGEDLAKTKEGIKEQLKQQKLSTKIEAWLANLQKNAKVINFVQY